MGWETRRNLSVLVLASIYINFFPVPVSAAGSGCAQKIAEESRSELTEEATRVLAEVGQTCENPSACSEESLAAAVESSVEKAPPQHRKVFGSLLRLSRRALVMLLWGASILGPGVISYYLTAGIPEGLRISVSNFVMVMGGVLFGRFSSPVEKRMGPKVETLSFWLWDPNEKDGWGQIMKRLPETDRLRFSQIYNQLIVLRSYFEKGGERVREGDTQAAARQYLNAILLSHELFAGLNLDHPTTVREVRTNLPELSKISPAMKAEILREAERMLREMPPEELYQTLVDHRDEVAEITRQTLRLWLSV